MRTLDTSCPLVVRSARVGGTPGPSQWKSGVPVTPVGRVTEQLRVTVSPAMTEEEGEEVREMRTVEIEVVVNYNFRLNPRGKLLHTLSCVPPYHTYSDSLCSSHITG